MAIFEGRTHDLAGRNRSLSQRMLRFPHYTLEIVNVPVCLSSLWAET
jgi:hypothetical protein